MDGTARSLVVTTADGAELAADVVVPARPTAIAVVCHPHPDYGGDRHNTVVSALFKALPAAGISALRFDFRRPVGQGLGRARDDVAAAVVAARREVPDVPLHLVGYSFGAMAALTALDDIGVIDRLALVAPPIGMAPPAAGPPIPTLVVAPAHDQFAPPDVVEPVVAEWPDADVEIVGSADHFLAGHTSAVAERVVAWLTEAR